MLTIDLSAGRIPLGRAKVGFRQNIIKFRNRRLCISIAILETRGLLLC